ncbi:MAG: hypothetical protein JXA94_01120 [Parachlamydiales bacterium]|nr:hypothetical protein [Parachlamydiales bacterium]
MSNQIINRLFKNPYNLDLFKSISLIISDLHYDKKDEDLKIAEIRSISKIDPYYSDIFFDLFPYHGIKKEIFKSLLPPLKFFNYEYSNMNLLTESQAYFKEEYNPYMGFIKNLTFYGTLKQKKDNTVYLEFESSMVNQIYPMTNEEIIKNKRDKLIIDVINKKEHEIHEVFPIQELGDKFKFNIKGFYSTKPETEENVEKLWFLEIESKQLEEFRSKYHLFSKKNGYNFVLVIAIKKSFKLRKSFPTMKINFSFSAA